MKLQITLLSCSPVALSDSRANEQFAGGLNYIPGSTLRGALAALCLRDLPGQRPNDIFKQLFLNPRVKYPDLLPALSETALSTIFPATTQACKRHKLKHPQSLEDTLLRQALLLEKSQAWEENPSFDFEELESLLTPKYCPTCQAKDQKSPLHYHSGYFAAATGPPYTIQPVRRVYRRLIAGTSISRTRGVAQQAMLFSREVLEEGQFFSGEIQTPDNLAPETLVTLLELLQPEGIIRVGYGRGRGLGKLQIVARCQKSPHAGPDLAERWQAFNNKAWQQTGLSQKKAYFSLTLASDWIRRGQTLPVPQTLPDGNEIGLPQAKRQRGVVNSTTVMGWNAAVKLPKESYPALKRGSVLLFSLPNDETQVKAAQTQLAQIEANGVGERRNEGFGRLSVCHPFHYQVLHIEEDRDE